MLFVAHTCLPVYCTYPFHNIVRYHHSVRNCCMGTYDALNFKQFSVAFSSTYTF